MTKNNIFKNNILLAVTKQLDLVIWRSFIVLGGSYQVLCSVAIEVDLRTNETIEYRHLD